MAKLIHGEIKFNNKCIGQLSDLMCILITNGYSVEIVPKEDTNEYVVTIMTQILEEDK